jgi:hypothetical protein
MRGVRLHCLAWLLAVCAAAACNDTTGPSPAELTLFVTEPVVARLEAGTGLMVLEFPVIIADPAGGGGTLATLATTVFNRSRNSAVVRNERPNGSFAFPEVTLPAGGSLTAQAGAVFTPPPPRDEIVVIVEARLSNGRSAQRTVRVAPIASSRPIALIP